HPSSADVVQGGQQARGVEGGVERAGHGTDQPDVPGGPAHGRQGGQWFEEPPWPTGDVSRGVAVGEEDRVQAAAFGGAGQFFEVGDVTDPFGGRVGVAPCGLVVAAAEDEQVEVHLAVGDGGHQFITDPPSTTVCWSMGAAVRRGLIGVLLSWAKAIPSTTEVSGRAWTSLRQRYLDQVRRVSSQPGEVYSGHPVSLPLNLTHECCLGPPLMRTAATPGGPPARLREGVDHAHGRTTWYRSGWSGPGLRRGSGRQLVFGGRTGVTTPAAQGAEEGKHRVGVADQVERQAGGDRPVDPLPLRGSCTCGHFRRRG